MAVWYAVSIALTTCTRVSVRPSVCPVDRQRQQHAAGLLSIDSCRRQSWGCGAAAASAVVNAGMGDVWFLGLGKLTFPSPFPLSSLPVALDVRPPSPFLVLLSHPSSRPYP